MSLEKIDLDSNHNNRQNLLKVAVKVDILYLKGRRGMDKDIHMGSWFVFGE